MNFQPLREMWIWFFRECIEARHKQELLKYIQPYFLPRHVVLTAQLMSYAAFLHSKNFKSHPPHHEPYSLSIHPLGPSEGGCFTKESVSWEPLLFLLLHWPEAASCHSLWQQVPPCHSHLKSTTWAGE